LADDTDGLIEVLDAVTASLTRALRTADGPDRVYALARAAILTEQARDALVNAKAPA
jgi:hypothetical protein